MTENKHTSVPEDFPVRPLGPDENPPGKTTCGYCGLSWDDDITTTYTPAPSARCPFEYFHKYKTKPMTETKTKHTAGPWEVDGHPKDIRPTEIVKRFPDGNCGLICELTHSLFRDSQLANARLIAAAPELLEAAIEALAYIENDEHSHGRSFSAGNALRAAIAKAVNDD